MFLAGVMFGIGFLVGMSGTVAIVMGLVALAEWVKNWWHNESERGRQEKVEEAEFHREPVNQAEFAISAPFKSAPAVALPSGR